MFPKETVEDIEWYRVSQDGTKVKIAYCSPSSPCRLLENCISSCPEYLTRLKTDRLSIILSNVKQADRGLEFQCQIHPKTMTEGPRAYMIKIKEISPREGQCDSRELLFCSVSDSLVGLEENTFFYGGFPSVTAIFVVAVEREPRMSPFLIDHRLEIQFLLFIL